MEKQINQQEELSFYKQLLKKEIAVIKETALTVRYNNYRISHNTISFQLELDENCSSTGDILRHVCEGNDINSKRSLFFDLQ